MMPGVKIRRRAQSPVTVAKTTPRPRRFSTLRAGLRPVLRTHVCKQAGGLVHTLEAERCPYCKERQTAQ